MHPLQKIIRSLYKNGHVIAVTTIFMCAFMWCGAPNAATAQTIKKPGMYEKVDNPVVEKYVNMVAAECPENWSSPVCLSVMSESNRVMVSNFMEELDRAGQAGAVESVKNSCAASTAAEKQIFPADAMKSAFIECANIISDTAATTRLAPDLAHYELLTAAVLCMSNDRRCVGITKKLMKINIQNRPR